MLHHIYTPISICNHAVKPKQVVRDMELVYYIKQVFVDHVGLASYPGRACMGTELYVPWAIHCK